MGDWIPIAFQNYQKIQIYKCPAGETKSIKRYKNNKSSINLCEIQLKGVRPARSTPIFLVATLW